VKKLSKIIKISLFVLFFFGGFGSTGQSKLLTFTSTTGHRVERLPPLGFRGLGHILPFGLLLETQGHSALPFFFLYFFGNHQIQGQPPIAE